MAAKPDPEDILMAELERQPVIDVSGVLNASGIGGGSSFGRTDGHWILLFTFAAWKPAGGDVQNRELTVRKPVSEKELRSNMGRFKSYEVVHIRARVAEQNSYGKPQALLDEIIGQDSNAPDLEKRALELQMPVTFNDERFGIFTLERRAGWYEAVVSWSSTKIRLTLSPPEGGDVKDCLPIARAIWDAQSVWQQRILDYAAARLLELKNDTWLDEDEAELSADEFKNRPILSSITVEANGDFEFWYDDGDLFWGHSIRVSGSLSEGPTFAGIEG